MAHWKPAPPKPAPKDAPHHAALPRAPRPCFAVLLVLAVVTPVLLTHPLRAYLSLPDVRAITSAAASPPLPFVPPPLTVITLIYRQPIEHANIEHNCALISRTRHRMVVFTDDTARPYCSVCECQRFQLRHCACPEGPDGCRAKNPCEKLLFVIDVLKKFKEIVLLDNDLIVLKDYFLDRLAARAVAHDFLATYGHKSVVSGAHYLTNFNSGLVFMRWLPELNYDIMRERMYSTNAEKDQGIISEFVQGHYNNWDTLSWKWHCRGLTRLSQDIPAKDCYTVHDKNDYKRVLAELNMTRLTLT